jgi:hypothetical protein
MALFSDGVPRLLAVATVLAGFCVLPPEVLSRGPNLCLWRHLLHSTACPACGSMRALAALFRGRIGEALDYNRNVLVTAPLLVALAAKDAFSLINKIRKPSFMPRPLTGTQKQ